MKNLFGLQFQPNITTKFIFEVGGCSCSHGSALEVKDATTAAEQLRRKEAEIKEATAPFEDELSDLSGKIATFNQDGTSSMEDLPTFIEPERINEFGLNISQEKPSEQIDKEDIKNNIIRNANPIILNNYRRLEQSNPGIENLIRYEDQSLFQEDVKKFDILNEKQPDSLNTYIKLCAKDPNIHNHPDLVIHFNEPENFKNDIDTIEGRINEQESETNPDVLQLYKAFGTELNTAGEIPEPVKDWIKNKFENRISAEQFFININETVLSYGVRAFQKQLKTTESVNNFLDELGYKEKSIIPDKAEEAQEEEAKEKKEEQPTIIITPKETEEQIDVPTRTRSLFIKPEEKNNQKQKETPCEECNCKPEEFFTTNGTDTTIHLNKANEGNITLFQLYKQTQQVPPLSIRVDNTVYNLHEEQYLNEEGVPFEVKDGSTITYLQHDEKKLEAHCEECINQHGINKFDFLKSEPETQLQILKEMKLSNPASLKLFINNLFPNDNKDTADKNAQKILSHWSQNTELFREIFTTKIGNSDSFTVNTYGSDVLNRRLNIILFIDPTDPPIIQSGGYLYAVTKEGVTSVDDPNIQLSITDKTTFSFLSKNEISEYVLPKDVDEILEKTATPEEIQEQKQVYSGLINSKEGLTLIRQRFRKQVSLQEYNQRAKNIAQEFYNANPHLQSYKADSLSLSEESTETNFSNRFPEGSVSDKPNPDGTYTVDMFGDNDGIGAICYNPDTNEAIFKSPNAEDPSALRLPVNGNTIPSIKFLAAANGSIGGGKFSELFNQNKDSVAAFDFTTTLPIIMKDLMGSFGAEQLNPNVIQNFVRSLWNGDGKETGISMIEFFARFKTQNGDKIVDNQMIVDGRISTHRKEILNAINNIGRGSAKLSDYMLPANAPLQASA